MTEYDEKYRELVYEALFSGHLRETRSGLVRSIFGYRIELDLSKGFPLLTTKKMFYRGVIEELLWFISGSTNIRPLVEKGVHIWDDDAYRYYKTKSKGFDCGKENFIKNVLNGERIGSYTFGDLGEVYGKNWRNYGEKGVDQLANVIDKLENDPYNRRIIIDAYNPQTCDEAALPPCHTFYQFYVTPLLDGKRLSCQFYCRSTDIFLGLPFNIASTAALVYMLCEVCGMTPGNLIYVGGDVHLYDIHTDAAREIVGREGSRDLPKLSFKRKIDDISDFKYEDFEITGYKPDGKIYAPLSAG